MIFRFDLFGLAIRAIDYLTHHCVCPAAACVALDIGLMDQIIIALSSGRPAFLEV